MLLHRNKILFLKICTMNNIAIICIDNLFKFCFGVFVINNIIQK